MPDGTEIVKNLAIYRCTPQNDPADYGLLDAFSGDEIDSYSATKRILSKFTGRLEEKEYRVPSRKNARMHDFFSSDSQERINDVAQFSTEQNRESEDKNDSDQSFMECTSEIVKQYIRADRSKNCILLIVEYKGSSDRFESEERVMIVQMPFLEGAYQPSSDSESLFTEMEEVFDDTLKKSVLYPYQEIADVDGDSEDQEIQLGKAFLYQGNGQADYWHEFLELDEELHADELLVSHRIQVLRNREKDVEEEDPFSEIESVEDFSPDDLPHEVEDRRESGVVVQLGGIEIHGLTVGEILDENPIKFYEDQDREKHVLISGFEPSIHPVGKGTHHMESEENDDEVVKHDVHVFPELSGYNDFSEIS